MSYTFGQVRMIASRCFGRFYATKKENLSEEKYSLVLLYHVTRLTKKERAPLFLSNQKFKQNQQPKIQPQ